MASSSSDDDYQSIGKQRLDICQASVTIGLVVKMSLSIGTAFSFNFCSAISACHCQQSLRNLKRKPSLLQHDRGTKLASLPSVTWRLPPLVSQWLWILHLWTCQRWSPAKGNQLCPLPHLIPDPSIRMQMFLRTPSTPPSLPLPPLTPWSHPLPTTTTTPTTASVYACLFPVFVSLQNLCHPRDCPSLRSRRQKMVGHQTAAHLNHKCVKIVISLFWIPCMSAVTKVTEMRKEKSNVALVKTF